MATTKTKEKTKKKSAKEKVEENRKRIVDKLISNMEKVISFLNGRGIEKHFYQEMQ